MVGSENNDVANDRLKKSPLDCFQITSQVNYHTAIASKTNTAFRPINTAWYSTDDRGSILSSQHGRSGALFR